MKRNSRADVSFKRRPAGAFLSAPSINLFDTGNWEKEARQPGELERNKRTAMRDALGSHPSLEQREKGRQLGGPAHERVTF